MEKLKIDKNIPIPKQRRKISIKYPIYEMNVKDSFFVEDKNKGAMIAAYANRRNPDKKFISRGLTDGSRVWRIK